MWLVVTKSLFSCLTLLGLSSHTATVNLSQPGLACLTSVLRSISTPDRRYRRGERFLDLCLIFQKYCFSFLHYISYANLYIHSGLILRCDIRLYLKAVRQFSETSYYSFKNLLRDSFAMLYYNSGETPAPLNCGEILRL